MKDTHDKQSIVLKSTGCLMALEKNMPCSQIPPLTCLLKRTINDWAVNIQGLGDFIRHNASEEKNCMILFGCGKNYEFRSFSGQLILSPFWLHVQCPFNILPIFWESLSNKGFERDLHIVLTAFQGMGILWSPSQMTMFCFIFLMFSIREEFWTKPL